VADKNVGTNKPVTLGSLALGNGTNGLASNYTFTGGTQTATITAAALTINAVTDSKIYDGTTSSVGAVTYNGLQTGDTLTGLTQTYVSRHALGANLSTLQVNGYTLTDGNGGLNYTVTANTAMGTITAKTLTSTASIGGTLSKTYDGTTAATGATVSGSVLGGITGDVITLNTTGLILNHNTANVATATTISATGTVGFTIGSSTAGSLPTDYSFTSPIINSVSGSITAALLSLMAKADSKIYDGLAYSGGNGYTCGGLVGSDTCTAAVSGTPTYSGSSQGAVNAGNYFITPGGLSSSNYTISFVDGVLTINPATLSQDAVQLITSTTINTTTDSTVTDFGPIITPLFIPPPPDTTGANLLKTIDPFGGNIGGTAGTFGSTDTSAPAPESGTAAPGSDGDTARTEDGRKGDVRNKDKSDKEDKDKGKKDAKPEKC